MTIDTNQSTESMLVPLAIKEGKKTIRNR